MPASSSSSIVAWRSSGTTSRASISAAIDRSASRMLLRRTSVGCAVSTGIRQASASSEDRRRDPTPPRLQCRHRVCQRTGSRRRIGLLAAHEMAVLGDVCEVGEVAEGTDNVDRVVARQPAQQRVETTGCRRLAIAAETQRGLAYLLDRRIHRIAFVGAKHVAKQLSQQPNVLAQRLVDPRRHQQPSIRVHDA